GTAARSYMRLPSGALERAGAFENLLQLSRFVELDRDVAAADQLAVHVELRERRPVRVRLQSLANLRVLEDVHVCEFRTDLAEHADRARRESALREVGGSLHVEQHRIGLQLLLDPFVDVHLLSSGSASRVRGCRAAIEL